MAERFPTEIAIGGAMKRAHIQALIDQINSEDLQEDWGCDCDRIKTEEDLLKHKKNKGQLWFCYESQSWGEFPDLEDFLFEHNISFDRHHVPRYEYNGELAQFRRGMKEVSIATADSDRVLIMDVAVAAGIRDRLKTDQSTEGIGNVLRELEALCVEFDIPELPPLEIVD